MRQYGMEYIKDFWNCIDLLQFGAFLYVFIHKLITQFQSDSFLEILFSAIILFLSIYKMMYFVRIYDGGAEIMTPIFVITSDLIPFGIICLASRFDSSEFNQGGG